MLKHVVFVDGLSRDCIYCDGLLLINATLSATQILEIIKVHLGGDVDEN